MPAPNAEVKSPSPPTPYMTARDVADLLKVSPKTVYRIAAEDATFPALRLAHGGTLRVHHEQLRRWLEQRTQGRQRRSA